MKTYMMDNGYAGMTQLTHDNKDIHRNHTTLS